MIHFKSNSSKIQTKEHQIQQKENIDLINENTSTTVNQINSTNDNLNINVMSYANLGKISTLLSETDYNEKIVNISKLDESLSFRDNNPNLEDNIQVSHPNYNSDCGLIIKELENNEEKNITSPVINISCLEIPINEINKIENNKKTIINNTNIIVGDSSNSIRSFNKDDDVFMFKKKNRICLGLVKKFIIIFFLIIISAFIFFIISKIFI